MRAPSTPLFTIREPARSVPVVHECDICVIGGSCTGVFAAVRAARLGARVAIVEKQNCFGGVATAGLVNIWHSLLDTAQEKQIIGGLTVEIIERLKRRQAVDDSSSSASVAYRLNTEELKIELDELVVSHGIRPFLHTLYAAPVLDGSELKAVVIENKNGRQAIVARQFIDASGDADLALDLGLNSFETDHPQPPTTCAKVAGLSTLAGFDWISALTDHGSEFDLPPDWGWGGPIPGLDDVQLRADTHVFDVDTSDAEDLTRAEIEGRRKIRAILDLIKRYGPTQARVNLVDLASTIGTREARRIQGMHRLTGSDVLEGRSFKDAIAYGSYRVDIHHAGRPGITFRYLDGVEIEFPGHGQKSIKRRWRPPQAVDPTYYQIPLRCLVQKQVPNLTMAGRMLDADAIAFSAARVMVNMNQTGEAAGVAAFLALNSGTGTAEVDPEQVRQALVEGGSIMPAAS